MQLLDDYNKIKENIQEYFGCEGVLGEINDSRENYWTLTETEVRFGEEEVESVNDDFMYSNELYGSKCIWRKEDYTLLSVDDGCGNQYYQIFDNKKEIKEG